MKELKITKNKDHVLFTNQDGEYHMSLDQFKKLGEKKSKEYAIQEINLKNQSSYQDNEIDFKRARALGFCEYGIEDFCEELQLNVKGTYKISSLLEKLTIDMFFKYQSECEKLFTREAVVNKFGGIKKMLSDNRTRSALNFVLQNNFIEEKQLHLLGCDFAERVLPIFEKEFPNDDRPRNAIKIKRLWIEEEYKS